MFFWRFACFVLLLSDLLELLVCAGVSRCSCLGFEKNTVPKEIWKELFWHPERRGFAFDY
jgi:hypothetical protein